MSITPLFNQRFSPAEASRGQFVPLDSSTISGYPSSDSEGVARGRYANLAYIVGSEPGAVNIDISGVVLNVSSINLSEPVDVTLTNVGQISSVSISNAITIKLPSQSQIFSQTIGSNTSIIVTFTPTINLLELYNKSTSNEVYFSFNTGLTFANLTATGLPLESEGFYSIERSISAVAIGNPNSSTTNVRVIGHNTV